MVRYLKIFFIVQFTLSLLCGEATHDIIHEMKKLEDKRDPKCYATASRLENFIYGTPLTHEARFKKNSLQKEWLKDIWKEASLIARSKHLTKINREEIKEVQKNIFTFEQTKENNWNLTFKKHPTIMIKGLDKKHYSSVAYALRALLSVEQEMMFNASTLELLPLSKGAIVYLRNILDLYTLAVLKISDEKSRLANKYQITAKEIEESWNSLKKYSSREQQSLKQTKQKYILKDLALLKQVIEQKVSSFSAYNNINNQIFVRNMQVYFARLSWSKSKKEVNLFKKNFTETMIYFTKQLYLGSQKYALKNGHKTIEEKDVFDFVQTFIPHKIDEFEDALFFPKLPKKEQVFIESYDMDSFRDSGLHWTYLKYAINEKNFKAYLEPNPFAMELIVENIAQFGVLALRMTGDLSKKENVKYLTSNYFGKALQLMQSKINKNAKTNLKTEKPFKLNSSKKSIKKNFNQTYFTDISQESGVSLIHHSSDWLNRLLRTYIKKDEHTGIITIPPAFGGSGVASEDINKDGYVDILILSGRGNRLYLNHEGKYFKDVTKSAGVDWRRDDNTAGEPRQPLIADINNDGYQDIIITYVDDTHRVYKNRGDGTFEDMSSISSLGGKGKVGGPAVLVDIDNDGLLDLYITYFGDYLHGVLPTLKRHNTNGGANQIFKNMGNFVFKDITQKSGLEGNGWSQAVTHTDFNNDGYQDIIVGNDFGRNGYYQNNKDGTFKNIVFDLGVEKASYTMSLGLTDLNEDKRPDIYVSNIVTMNKDEKYVLPKDNTTMKFNPTKLANMRVVEANDLFLSNKDENNTLLYHLSYLVGRGYSSTGWSWDADFFDYDNDGDDDLYVVNGMNEFNIYSSENPYYADPNGKMMSEIYIPVSPKEKNVLFENSDGLLENQSKKSGLDILTNSRSASYLDYDNDGDLDIILNNYHQKSYFFKNNSEKFKNNWLKITLKGDVASGVNLDAIGSVIYFKTKSGQYSWRQISSTTGYMSVHPKEQHIGLGKSKYVDISIKWSNGKESRYNNIPANHHILIKYNDSKFYFK